MYSFYYAENLQDVCEDSRGRERSAMEHVIERLRLVKDSGLETPEAISAMHEMRRLWSFFIEDLAAKENDLPEALRADLISVGLFVMKELDRIRNRESDDLDSIIEINTIIRDGLK